ncbi:UBX domain-containing protein 10 [Chanos chanos]|uniref:UBX domain-containing protein 10 n=1 Tax=Chanos chanos TaxID=29144 RepID=A0A6J2UWU0_CHACN|nr:UBX domain-containing protein 10 [Chanos chanos]
MHGTRPKSSKGRSRPKLYYTQSVDDSVCRHPSAVSQTPSEYTHDRFHRSNSHLKQTSTTHPGTAPEIFRNSHTRSANCLSKYKVLPPIEPAKDSSSKVLMTKESLTIDEDVMSLLLAIRAPCGRRFNGHFYPSDTLQAIITAAEAKYGTSYERCLIETMDVPRRTFRNLTMTFAQCGILNKSVLCITEDTALDST